MSDELQQRRATAGRSVIVGTLLAVLSVAVATLFLPPDGDQALFYVSGRKLLAGDVLYRDIVDLKPPMIYFLNAAAVGLFGESFLSVRILETLFQLGAALLIFLAVRRGTGRPGVAAVSAVLFAVLYFGMNFNDRAQVEGFAMLPLAGILYLVCARGAPYRYLLAGVLLGLLGLLKTTLLIVLVPILIILLIHYPPSLLWRRALLTVIGMLLPYGAMFLYLTATGAMHDYMLVQNFVAGYASQQIGSPMALLNRMIRFVPTYIAGTWTLLVFALLVIGIGNASGRWMRGGTRIDRRSFDSPRSVLLLFTLVTGLLLAGTIVLEGKFLSWHFVRLLLPVAIVAGAGCQGVLDYLSSRLCSRRRALAAAVLLAVPVILFSPLPRLLWTIGASVASMGGGTEGFTGYYGDGNGPYNLQGMVTLGKMIESEGGDTEGLFVASGWGGLVHYSAGSLPDFKIYHSGYLIAPYSPREWKLQTASYLTKERPGIIVLQRDAMPHITGTDMTSEQAVRALPGIDRLLRSEYDTLFIDTGTLVLKRREGMGE